MRIALAYRAIVAIQSDGLRSSRLSPLRSAKQDADVRAVERQNARRRCAGLDGMIDGREQNEIVLSHVDDDSAASQVRDDLAFGFLDLRFGCVTDDRRDSDRKRQQEREPQAATNEARPENHLRVPEFPWYAFRSAPK